MDDTSAAERAVEADAQKIILFTLLSAIAIIALILGSLYYVFKQAVKMTSSTWDGWLSFMALALVYLYLNFKLSPRILASSLRLWYMSPDEYPSLRDAAMEIAARKGVPAPKMAIMPASRPLAMTFGNSMTDMTLVLSEELLRGETGNPRAVLEESIGLLKYRSQVLMTFFSGLPLMASIVASALLGKRRSLAPYFESSEPVIRKMLEMADVKPDETVYDLGSGDGRVLIIAAKDFDARSVGIELDKRLVEKSVDKINSLHLGDKARVIRGDLFRVDLGEADVVTLFMGITTNMKIRPKLERELKSGARVVCHDYEIPGWKPARVEEFSEVDDSDGREKKHFLYLYVRP